MTSFKCILPAATEEDLQQAADIILKYCLLHPEELADDPTSIDYKFWRITYTLPGADANFIVSTTLWAPNEETAESILASKCGPGDVRIISMVPQ